MQFPVPKGWSERAYLDADTLAALLGPGFELQETLRHTHKTPWGSEQRFQYSAFKREES